MFTPRHGKNMADSRGSVITTWLRGIGTTLQGLKPDLDKIIKNLEKCIKDNKESGGQEFVIIPWKPTTERPTHKYTLSLGNMKMSNSKMMQRSADNKIIQSVVT